MTPLNPGNHLLGTARPASPYSDPERLRRLIDQLPATDSVEVLRHSTQWLKDITQDTELEPPAMFLLIETLDKGALHHQFNLVPDYLDTPRMHKVTESRLWSSSFDFCQALGAAYLSCLERYQAAPDRFKEFQPQLPTTVCRILHALATQCRWTSLRYGKVAHSLWRDLGITYLISSSWGLAFKKCSIHAEKPGSSTIQQEMLKTLMFAMSGPDTLTPKQQYIATRVIAYLSDRFALHNTPGPGCMFHFDLSLHRPPSRSKRELPLTPMLRFFGPGTSNEALLALKQHLHQQGRLPMHVGIGEKFEPIQIDTVLDHLTQYWADHMGGRRSQRNPTMDRLTVVPGLSASVKWLCEQTQDPLTRPPESAESWVVFDRSNTGCGAELPTFPADWLEIGALMALCTDSDAKPQMAVARRIAQSQGQHHQVGLEFVGERAIPVQLRITGTTGSVAAAGKCAWAILLNQQADASGHIELLMHPGCFTHSKQLNLQVGDHHFTIDRVTCLEETREFQRLVYRVMSHPG